MSLLGVHYRRPPTWWGDQMCVCGGAPYPCNYAQVRDKLLEMIGDG